MYKDSSKGSVILHGSETTEELFWKSRKKITLMYPPVISKCFKIEPHAWVIILIWVRMVHIAMQGGCVDIACSLSSCRKFLSSGLLCYHLHMQDTFLVISTYDHKRFRKCFENMSKVDYVVVSWILTNLIYVLIQCSVLIV